MTAVDIKIGLATLYGARCRCGHEWIPRGEKPRVCPKCKSPYWDRPKAIPEIAAPVSGTGASTVPVAADTGRIAVKMFKEGYPWPRAERGPAPGETGCTVPPEILKEFGYAAKAAH